MAYHDGYLPPQLPLVSLDVVLNALFGDVMDVLVSVNGEVMGRLAVSDVIVKTAYAGSPARAEVSVALGGPFGLTIHHWAGSDGSAVATNRKALTEYIERRRAPAPTGA